MAIPFNIILLLLLIVFYGIIPDNRYFITGIFSLAVMGSAGFSSERKRLQLK